MIKLEIKIKEEKIEDFENVTATMLNVSIKEKSKNETIGELEAMKIYKQKMGFDGNLLVVNNCKNEKNFKDIEKLIVEQGI